MAFSAPPEPPSKDIKTVSTPKLAEKPSKPKDTVVFTDFAMI